jgi:hypothetical protein
MQSSRLCFSIYFIKGLTEIAIGVNGNALTQEVKT